MTDPVLGVDLERTQHGPFERIVCSYMAPNAGLRAQVSIYRVGDTLFDSGSTNASAAFLRAISTHPPRRIILTHQHEDHIGNVAAVRRAFGNIPVYAPRKHLDIIARSHEVPPHRNDFWGHPEPVSDAIAFDPGDHFQVGPLEMHAVETPGHTPGHIAWCCTFDNVRYCLSGDLYTNRPLHAWYESAADDMVRSYRLLANTAHPMTMLPTHGRVRTDASSMLHTAADELEREMERVFAAADQLNTRDVLKVTSHLFPDDPLFDLTQHEIGFASWVRSVLEPVRDLPARPIVSQHLLTSS